ncbi:MAG TPA: Xaa-Pro peptidase family protein [Chloroflexota bacterium]
MKPKPHPTWDDKKLAQDRQAGLQAELRERGIGAMYLSDTMNLRYVLNLKVPGGGVFIPAEGEVIAFIKPRDMGYVRMHHSNIQPTFYQSADTETPAFEEKVKRFAQVIYDLMVEHGVGDSALAVDPLDASAYNALSEAGVRVANASPIVEYARSVKTNDEVAIYRRIGEQYVYTMSAFRDALKPGISERELAGIVTAAWSDADGEEIAQLNICSGENMNPWRRWPTERKLVAGEFAGIDLHGRGPNGMRGDASRTFFVGDNPSQEQRDLYRRAYDYLLRVIDVVRAGTALVDVRDRAPSVPEKYAAQLYNYSIIHGIGLNHSGFPHVEKRKRVPDGVLRPNQVFAVECYFGEEGSPLAVKLEEDVIVRDGAPERLAPNIPFDERFTS